MVKNGTDEVLTQNYAPSQLTLVLDDFTDRSIYEVEEVITHH